MAKGCSDDTSIPEERGRQEKGKTHTVISRVVRNVKHGAGTENTKESWV
jgi:hypothetical protein